MLLEESMANIFQCPSAADQEMDVLMIQKDVPQPSAIFVEVLSRELDV